MSRWPTPDGDRGMPGSPGNLAQPATGVPWPAGNRGAGSEAEELLAGAVAWWDVGSAMRNGDRWLRNRGVAGSCLDMRLGSSTLPNTNDPLYLAPEDGGYVNLDVSNNLTVPDEAALRITGDLDVRFHVGPETWTPSAFRSIGGRYANAQRAWRFTIETNGTLGLYVSPDGSTALTVTSSVASSLIGVSWVRGTVDVDNGAGGWDANFYTSQDGANWVQLGTTRTTAGTISIYAGTSPFTMPASTSNAFVGKIYRAQVFNGIDGTCVLDVDCDALTSGGQTSFLARTGQTVTIGRSTSGRKAVAMPSRNLVDRRNGLGDNLLTVAQASGTGTLTSGYQCSITQESVGAWDGPFTRMTATVAGGGYYANITGPGAAAIPIPPWASVLTVSARVKMSVAGSMQGWSLNVVFWNGSGAYVTESPVPTWRTDKPTEWSLVTGNIATPAGAYYAQLRVQVLSSGVTVGDTVDSDVLGLWAGTDTTWKMPIPEVRKPRPVLLFGTDDYLECQGAEQHKWLNIDAGQSFTVLGVARPWGTSVNGAIVDKRVGNLGYQLRITNGVAQGVTVSRATDGNSVSDVIARNGTVGVFAFTVSPSLLRMRTNGATATATNLALPGIPSTQVVRIGYYPVAGTYADMEFLAAAIFRRALTDREIALLTAYYGAA